MPQTSFIGDALSVVTISLTALLVLVGLFCIIYSFYFQSRINGQRLVQLSYFNGPWIIRITYIFLVVWWCVGEVVRLNLLKRNRRFLGGLTLTWQENVCKFYIVSNLGFSEPCLFLTFIFLLRASLQKSGTLSRKWNVKTAGFILLYCFPIFVLQLLVILIGPRFERSHSSKFPKLPSYFVNAANITSSDVAVCRYPLLSTAFLGLYSIVLTGYIFWLGRRILHLVINKGLQKRVYTLIFSISSLFPLRVILLGLSVLPHEDNIVIDALSFLAFLSLLCCSGFGICLLVYLPIADSLSLRSLQRDMETVREHDEYNDTTSLIANQSESVSSFHGTEKDEASGVNFVELSLFNPSQHSSPPGSPKPLGWPMILPGQG